MTVPTSDNREQYLGNDSATEFDYTFKIFKADDLVVTLTDSDDNESTLTRGTDYSVDGVGNENGGSVTYPLSGDPLASGETLTILREIPVVQETDLRNQGRYYPETLEDEFDRSRMIDQQQEEKLSRTLSRTRASDYFDAKGRRIANVGDATEDQDAYTKGQADARFASDVITKAGGHWDAKGLRLDSLADAVSDEQAVNRRTMEAYVEKIESGPDLTFSSVADMQANENLYIGQHVRTLGYYEPGDGGGNDYEIVAAGTGTDDGGSYIDLPGSGLQGKGLFSKYTCDEQFGASESSSSTVNYEAISAAIAYVSSIGGGQLLVGPGNKTVSASIGIPDDVQILGMGWRNTTLSSGGDFSVFEELRGEGLTNLRGSSVGMMCIRGGGKDSPNAHGIRVRMTNHFKLHDLVFFSCRHAIDLERGFRSDVRSCYVFGSGTDQSHIALYMREDSGAAPGDPNNAWFISDCSFQQTQSYGVRVESATGTTFNSIRVGGCGDHGWYIGDPPTSSEILQWIWFVQVHSDTNTGDGYKISQGNASELQELYFESVWAGTVDNGFSISGGRRIGIYGGTLRAIGQYGMAINNVDTLDVDGVHVIDYNGGGAGNPGIGLTSVNNSHVSGCTITTGNLTGAPKSLTENLCVENKIIGNELLHGGTPANTSFWHYNSGFKTQSSGSSDISAGTSSVTVSHGLDYTPSIDEISVLPKNNLTANGVDGFWISNPTSSTFTINFNTNTTNTVGMAWNVRRIQ